MGFLKIKKIHFASNLPETSVFPHPFHTVCVIIYTKIKNEIIFECTTLRNPKLKEIIHFSARNLNRSSPKELHSLEHKILHLASLMKQTG